MTLLYSLRDLFKGKLPIPKKLYEVLEDLDKRITDGVEPRIPVKNNVKLTNKNLVKAFGKNFDSIGVVNNKEGSYLIIAEGDSFKHIGLEKI